MEYFIKTQEELDNLDINVSGTIYITGSIRTISKSYENANLVIQGNAVIDVIEDDARVGIIRNKAVIGVIKDNATVNFKNQLIFKKNECRRKKS